MIGSVALQKAVYAALNGAITGGVYDEVPPGAAAPYTVIGESAVTSWDTHDADGADESITLHAWSRARGWSEVKGIMQEIHGLLHGATLALDVGQLALLQVEYETTLRDESEPGTVWRHGVMRFRALITT